MTLYDLEWLFCVKFCFTSVCLEVWNLIFEACSECCRRTLNQKEQLRHRAVSLRQHGFLVYEVFVRCCLKERVRLRVMPMYTGKHSVTIRKKTFRSWRNCSVALALWRWTTLNTLGFRRQCRRYSSIRVMSNVKLLSSSANVWTCVPRQMSSAQLNEFPAVCSWEWEVIDAYIEVDGC